MGRCSDVGQLVTVGLLCRRMNYCRGASTAQQCFHLLSEVLVYESVDERVDSSIEEDYCVDNGVNDFIHRVRCTFVNDMGNCVS